MGSDRLRYLVYRCYRCGNLLTKFEILKRWEEAEKDISIVHSAICHCGSRHLTPTNASLWEELTKPKIWKLWYLEVLVPWLKKRLGK